MNLKQTLAQAIHRVRASQIEHKTRRRMANALATFPGIPMLLVLFIGVAWFFGDYVKIIDPGATGTLGAVLACGLGASVYGLYRLAAWMTPNWPPAPAH